MIVVFSRRALADLDGIFDDLISRASASVAHRLVDRIERRCLSLEAFPDRGKRLEGEGLHALRRLIEPPYVIVYESRATSVEIVSVLYESRDIEAELRRSLG